MYSSNYNIAGDFMILIIGGAYQGKLKYAKDKYNIKDSDINNLSKESLDLSKKCIYHMEELAFSLIDENKNVIDEVNRIMDNLKDKIIIIDDIFSGVVPIKKDLRIKREEAAKMACLLSKNASSIIRIYLGLDQIIK